MQILDINLQPAYGQRQALVRWSSDVALEAQNPVYHIYRSPDGAGDWERANTDPVDALEYLDTNFHFNSRLTVPHYRVLAVLPNGDMIDSPTKGLYQDMSRQEYAACSYMIRQEYKQIRHDGWKILHYIPLTRGEIQPGWDGTTGQLLKDCPGEDDGYGQKYVGGYRDPFYTVLHPGDMGPIIKQRKDDGIGVFDQNKITVRMLAFPQPQPGHLIVHPSTDNRWMVTEAVKPFLFKGNYPIAHACQLELLRRESPAYRLPIPDLSTLKLP